MTPKELLSSGEIEQALHMAKEDVRNHPDDSAKRVFLTQLQFVCGTWDAALNNLAILQDLDSGSMLFAQTYRPVVESELLRKGVFSGATTPIVFGEPDEWICELSHANQLIAQGKIPEFEQLQATAFDKAPVCGGLVDGEAFQWIADADSRLGPLLEVITSGGYRWIPFSRIEKIKFEPITDLRDLVWRSCFITLSNGGSIFVFVPVRYPGSESVESPAIRLARRTEWLEKSPKTSTGLGQRILTTNSQDYALLDIKEIIFSKRA